jgi:carbamoyl-phosphate synthase small subunit
MADKGLNMFLYLENGKVLKGEPIGHSIEAPFVKEIVFNTSMSGYQEIITDPSYCDQMIVLTFPTIGNYGTQLNSSEALTPYLSALIVKEISDFSEHYQTNKNLETFLKEFKIPGIAGVDTRYITQEIRKNGTMKAILSPRELNESEKTNLFSTNLVRNQISKVSTKEFHHYPGSGKRLVMIDFGYKKNILTSLLKRNADIIIVPFNTNYEDIIKFNPQGIVLSNGPGDPKDIPEVLPTIKKLQTKFPMLGICMGHQILALANNLNTTKLKFGHRGANHPVKDLKSNKIFLTSQNHGYTVLTENIEKSELFISQININDGSIEGLQHKHLPVFSVQYHPEASPGPEDTNWVFDQFLSLINKEKNYAY